MKTERQIRLENEINNVSAADLSRPMYDLNEDVISGLVSEAGYSSAKSYLNDGRCWSNTLESVIESLVDSIYTCDGELFDSQAELNAAVKAN